MMHISRVGFKSNRMDRIEWEHRMENAWKKVPTEKRRAPKCSEHQVFMRPKVSRKGNPFFGCPKWPACGNTKSVNSFRPLPTFSGRVRFITGSQR